MTPPHLVPLLGVLLICATVLSVLGQVFLLSTYDLDRYKGGQIVGRTLAVLGMAFTIAAALTFANS